MDKKIKTVAEFVETVVNKEYSKNRNEESQAVWFRGEGKDFGVTRIIPKSYRAIAAAFNDRINDHFYSKRTKQLENNIQAEFMRRAHKYISSKNIENSYWNRYFLMQHYNISTRLLDWTENAMIALFFALSDKTSYENDAVVWILRPFILNDLTLKTITQSKKSFMVIPPTITSDNKQQLLAEDGKIRAGELMRRYIKMDFSDDSGESQEKYFPLAILPNYLDERMTAQKTCFTIFGNKLNGLLSNEHHPNFLSSVIIEGGPTKKRMLNELQLLGIDYESVFPDLDGIGLSIQSKFQKYFDDTSEIFFHVLDNFENK